MSPDRPPAPPGYEILSLIAASATASVLRARRVAGGEEIALKISQPLGDKPQVRAEILRAIEIMRDVDNPSVARLLDAGESQDRLFFAMELCHGGSLEALRLRRGGTLPSGEAVDIIVKALAGLAFMHERHVVHRDLKPSNVLFADREMLTPKIADFGMAKVFFLAGLSRLTETGTTGGTVPYMPREQAINFKRVEPVSDVFSMGATLYALLTGLPPRDFPPGRCDASMVLMRPVVPVQKRRAEMPSALAAVVDRAVADSAKNRFQTAMAFRSALLEVRPTLE